MATVMIEYNPDRLLNKHQVAERLGLKHTTVSTYRQRGMDFFSTKALIHAGHLVWKESDLNEYIANLPYADDAA